MKKCIALVLVLLALVCCAAADKPTEYTCGDYTYILLEDGTAEIAQYTGGAVELVVPDALDGYRVTGIGDSAFFMRYSLTSITIPDGVTQIGANAFGVCRKLTTINVSPSHPVFETIDGVLFDKTEKRLICYPCAFKDSSYTVPNGTLSIGEKAFYGCRYLMSITLPESVTSIEKCAFDTCHSLTSIVLPDSMTSIGEFAFFNCGVLTSITLPNGVTRIEDATFSGCSGLTSITLPDGVTSIGMYAFEGCARLKSITLPDSVTSIGTSAFKDCNSLMSITLPEGVTSIGGMAFENCKRLTLVVLPKSVTSIGWEPFNTYSYWLLCIVPANSYAEQWCKEHEISFVTGNTEGVALYLSDNFVYFRLDDGTAQIDMYLGGAQWLAIPEQLDGRPVTAVGRQAFQYADLVSITLPDSVTKLEGNPFSACGQLAEVWVSPDHPTLATIDGVLFDKTDKTLLCYPAGLGAQSYAVPDGIRSIGAEAFGGCRLMDVTLPASVADVAADAFAGGQGGIFFTVPRDSYAAQWCRDNNVRYTYPDANNWLLN